VARRVRTLPLGVDLGRARVRVALMAQPAGEDARLLSVAARDHDGDPLPALQAALAELQTRERRCVLALAAPEAAFRYVDFPPMPDRERWSAAAFEAARDTGLAAHEICVSLTRDAGGERWILATARRDALERILRIATRARLRPIAVDDAAFALRRAHPEAEGIVDVGYEATSVTMFAGGIPVVTRIETGGAHFSRAIALGLGIDRDSAEQRKRVAGFGGAGTSCRDAWLAAVTAALAKLRLRVNATIGSLLLCGNGARVPQLADDLMRASGCSVALAALPPQTSDIVPADVLRAAAPDWSLSCGLARWTHAR
jgi:Tfp pilus assembly PilM family ATPase